MKTRINTSFIQWSIRDSNPWPQQCECCALPTALIPRNGYGNNGARTHDLPLVRRALSQLSYVSTSIGYYITLQQRCIALISLSPRHDRNRLHMLRTVPFLYDFFGIADHTVPAIWIVKIIPFFIISDEEHTVLVGDPRKRLARIQ